jgi:hypothetical protein
VAQRQILGRRQQRHRTLLQQGAELRQRLGVVVLGELGAVAVTKSSCVAGWRVPSSGPGDS